jgi:transcriptional regulator with XRE-family HTH domain
MLDTSLAPLPPTFGNTVRHLRVQQGMTPAQLGARAKLSEAELEAFEGGRRVPDLSELYALGIGLGMKVSAIMRVWESTALAHE